MLAVGLWRGTGVFRLVLIPSPWTARGGKGEGGALVLKRNQTLGSSKGFCLTSYTVCLVPTRERRHFLLGGVSKCKGDRPLSTTDRRLPQVPTLEIFARAPMTELQ